MVIPARSMPTRRGSAHRLPAPRPLPAQPTPCATGGTVTPAAKRPPRGALVHPDMPHMISLLPASAASAATAEQRPGRKPPPSPCAGAQDLAEFSVPFNASAPPSKRKRTVYQSHADLAGEGSPDSAAVPQHCHSRSQAWQSSLLQPPQPPLPLFLQPGQPPAARLTRSRRCAASTRTTAPQPTGTSRTQSAAAPPDTTGMDPASPVRQTDEPTEPRLAVSPRGREAKEPASLRRRRIAGGQLPGAPADSEPAARMRTAPHRTRNTPRSTYSLAVQPAAAASLPSLQQQGGEPEPVAASPNNHESGMLLPPSPSPPPLVSGHNRGPSPSGPVDGPAPAAGEVPGGAALSAGTGAGAGQRSAQAAGKAILRRGGTTTGPTARLSTRRLRCRYLPEPAVAVMHAPCGPGRGRWGG